jgi:hypothetical protein
MYIKSAEDVNTLCKMTPEGEVTAMFSRVPLRSENGEWHPMRAKGADGKTEVRKAITAMGFQRLNGWIGVNFASPPTLWGGDGEVGNPHIERDGSTAKRASVRRIGVGRNKAGVLMAVDLTLTYDLGDYAACELYDAWRPGYNEKNPAAWGRIVGSAEHAHPKPHEKVVACPGDIYLVVDLTAQKPMQLWSQVMQRQKFAERMAVSICERNILKRFVGTAYCSEDATVPIVHWSSPDRSRSHMQRVFEKIQDGEVQIEGEDVHVESLSEVIDHEEASVVLAGDGEDAPEEDAQSPAKRRAK